MRKHAIQFGLSMMLCSGALVAAGELGDSTGGDSLYERGNTYQRVESEVDRGTGRIVDQQTHELDRIDRMQQRPSQRPYEALEEDRDRQQRIDAVRRRAELDRRLAERMMFEPPSEPSITSLPPVFDSPLLRWILTREAALNATQPAGAVSTTQPAER